MPPEPERADDTSTLERLRQKLYAPVPEPEPVATSIPVQAPVEPMAPGQGWAPPPVTPAPVLPPKKRRVSFAVMFLIGAAAFFVIAAAAATYFLVFGGRSVSTDRIDIAIDGPIAIASGDVVTLLVSVQNDNPVTVTDTVLSITLPDTARNPDDESSALAHIEDSTGDILPGEAGTKTVRAILYGSEEERITIPVRFEYRVEGSNATYVKEAEYEVTITSSPLSIRAEAVSEASSGQPLSFAVTVRSNAKAPMENVAVLASYPFGFAAPRGEGNLFVIGTLAPGEERTIPVTGTVTGENNDERVFRFTVGTIKDSSAKTLATSYSTASAAVTLAKPFLQAGLSVNRDTSASPVIEAGTAIQGIVSWENTLAAPILDGQITVALKGEALDPASVSTYGGYYRSSDSTIIFSRDTTSSLARLDPGATGSGTFTFSTKPASTIASLRNPSVTATVSVAGRRVGESNVPQTVNAAVVRTMKVATDLSLSSRALYSAGAFKNTGPWPPVADQETTYGIELSFSNTVNSVADATVTMTLPSYVRYVAASPNDGSVSYNATTRTVTWKAGDILAGAGFTGPAKKASFQVALLPSASQRGTSPVLVSAQKVTGVDRFTQGQISFVNPELTTQTIGDPAFVSGKGEVR